LFDARLEQLSTNIESATQTVLTATYQNGVLILNEKMSEAMEGKTFKIIIREEIAQESKKQLFLKNVNKYANSQ
jgi:predicted DNA-binding antitoxin AbrB/MazE fold protein